jgi:hypothetical protein
MLENHAKELINRAIDGDLSESEQTERQALLEGSEEARAYSEDMAGLANLLAEVEPLEPPVDLQGRILRNIQLPRPKRWFTSAAGWMQGRPISYGIAAAAGLLVAVAFYELSPRQSMDDDIASLVGTVARGNGDRGMIQLSFLDIDLPAVHGKVLLSGKNDLKLLRFDVASDAAVEFEVALAGSGLAFGGFAQEAEAGSDNFSFSGSSFSVTNQGEKRFTVILRDESAEGAVNGGIVVSVSRQGEDLYRGVLSL